MHSSVVTSPARIRSEATASGPTRIRALDGLRGIAILLVLLRHSVFGAVPQSRFLSTLVNAGQLTWSGVDLFFVLSGFLIGGILMDARQSPHYFQTFYARRFFRIFPLYFLVCGLFLFRHFVNYFLPHTLSVSPLEIPWGAYVTLTQNFWMAQLGWYGSMAMSVTWSLAVEEQFYLTIPLIIRITPRRWLLSLLIAVVAGAPLLRLALRFYLPHGDFASYVLTPCRADALSLGVLAAMLVRWDEGWNAVRRRQPYLLSVTLALFLGIAWMTYWQFGQLSLAMTTWGYSWLAFFYTGCLLLALCSNGPYVRMLSNRYLVALGTLAYCSYLIHRPLIDVGRRICARFPLSAAAVWSLGGLIGFAATIAVAAVSWKYYEKPLLKRGHQYNY